MYPLLVDKLLYIVDNPIFPIKKSTYRESVFGVSVHRA